MDDWQIAWPFDFATEYKAGTAANDAAMRANRFWWKRQNKSIGQDCRRSPNCSRFLRFDSQTYPSLFRNDWTAG
jgi:hypothetical protein